MGTATAEETEAALDEDEDEAPTPFPNDKLWKWQFEWALKLMPEDEEEELDEDHMSELIEALDAVYELHNSDRQWIRWPDRMEDSRHDPYWFGCFKFLRGLRLCIMQSYDDDLREISMELLYALSVGGYNLTRVPPAMLVDCGMVNALVKAGRETADKYCFKILNEIVRFAPAEMVPAVIKGGSIQLSIDLLDTQDALPLQQLAALDLILSLAKKAPIKTAQAGAYEAVKIVANPALIPRRNKIMNLLRPLVKEDENGQMSSTNLRIGGIKY